ncbi:hypothetical protein BH10PSE17_BH10PSE17_16900 [soil metagenome]
MEPALPSAHSGPPGPKEYRIDASGHVLLYRDGAPLDGHHQFSVLNRWQRRELLPRLDRRLVRAAWLMHDRRCTVRKLNDLVEHHSLVLQVVEDCPKLLPLVLHAIERGWIGERPARTTISRFRSVLMRSGAPDHWSTFWSGTEPLREALTPSGWRFLLRQSLVSLRDEATGQHDLRITIATLNQLARLQFAPVGHAFIWIATGLDQALADRVDESSRLVAWRALRRVVDTRHEDDLFPEIDTVRDWIRDTAPVLHARTAWSTLLRSAREHQARRARVERESIRRFAWTPSIEAFATEDGITIEPLCNGDQLIEEGETMQNCLAYTIEYAAEAAQGRSQVFRLSGSGDRRATVEFVMRDERWVLMQAFERGNRRMRDVGLRRALASLVDRICDAGS